MTDYQNFGLDDLMLDEEDTTRKLVTGIAWLVGGAFLLFSALTSYQFFARYASAVGDFVADATLAPIVAGVIGVLLLDVGAFAWQLMRAYHASTAEQMSIALAASALDFLLSLATSALFVVLSSAFDVGVYDAGGALTSMGQTLQYVGVATVTLGLVVNFASLYLYQAKASATREAQQRTGMRALVLTGRHRADKARAQLVTQRSLRQILEALPGAADELATANSGNYFASTMRQARQPQPALDAEQLNALLAQLGYADAVGHQHATGHEDDAQRFGFSLVDIARAQATQAGGAPFLRRHSRQQ